MAQIKDLVVTGQARIVNKLYASHIVGDIEGKATEAEAATFDNRGQAIDETYIKDASIDQLIITFTRGDNTVKQIIIPNPQTLIENGTDIYDGLTKLYNETGNHIDGAITQKVITELLGGKLGVNDTAVKADADGNGDNIRSTYIKGVTVSDKEITFERGDGTTFSITTYDTEYNTATSVIEGLVKLYGTTGVHEDGTMTQKAITDALNEIDTEKINKTDAVSDIEIANKAMTITKGDGSTYSFDVQDITTYDQATSDTLGLVKLQQITGDSETDVMSQKAISEQLARKLSITATAQAATNDAIGNPIVDYLNDVSVEGRDITFVRGNGKRKTITTQDTTYDQATPDTLGLVRLQQSKGQSETDVVSQKFVTDQLNSQVQSVAFSSNHENRTLTYTRGDGSTYSHNIGYDQATDNELGLVKLQQNKGQSTTDVVSQKFVTDQLNDQVQSVDATVDHNTRVLTFTKGDGSTYSHDISYDQATDNELGLVKLQQNKGQSTTDVVSQKFVTDQLNSQVQSVAFSSNHENRTLTYTNGDGSTYSHDISYGQATDDELGLVRLQQDKGQSETDVVSQKFVTDQINNQIQTIDVDVSGSTRTLKYSKGDGSTYSKDISYTQATDDALGLVKLHQNKGQSETDVVSQKFVTDQLNDQVQSVDATVNHNTRVLTFTNGDGSTYSKDISYDQATDDELGLVKLQQDKGQSTTDVVSQKFVTDQLNSQVQSVDIDVSDSTRTLNYSKGDGSTYSKDISYDQATSSALGLVKLQQNKGQSTTDVVSQKFVTDQLNAQVQSVDATVNHNTRVLTFTNGDGSTYSKDISYDQATDDELGLVRLQQNKGQSETDVVSQKFVTDQLNDQIQNVDINVSGSTRTLNYSKGDGSTYSKDISYTQATATALGLVKLQQSKGQSETDVVSQKFVTDQLDDQVQSVDVDVSGSTRTLNYSKGNGSTYSKDISYKQATASALGLVKLQQNKGQSTTDVVSQKFVTDQINNQIQTVDVDVSDSTRTLKYSKGDGSTYSKDISYDQATDDALGLVRLQQSKGQSETDVVSQKFVTDQLNAQVQSVDATVSHNTRLLTFTNGDGSTYSKDISYDQATASELGLVKLQQNKGQSETDVVSQKFVTDQLNDQVQSVAFSSNHENRTLTYTKGDGSTYSHNISYGQATASELGLVKLRQAAGTSTTDVMSQKATTDQLNSRINDVSLNSTGIKREFTFTRGDGSTFSLNSAYAQANSSALGLTKLYGDASSENTDGAVTQKGVKTELANLKTNLETQIGKVFNVSIVSSFNALPVTGDSRTIYFVPLDGSDQETNNKYNEYIWIADGGYYELFGLSVVDLHPYYTSTQTDAAIKTNTDPAVVGASVSGRTITFTKKNSDTFSFQTQDTTYSDFGVNKSGLVPTHAANQNNYVLTGAGWAAKAPNATNADTATYATNAGTAAYGTKAGTATEANHAARATNADTATYATNAGTAASATKDSDGQQINTTYLKNATVSGRNVTFTKGDGSTFAITTQDNNTTYANMGNATTAANGTAGLVPAPTKAQYNYYLTGHGWDSNVGTAAYATNAGTAAYGTNAGTAASATKDSAGQQISTTYLKNATVSGRNVTFTKGDGSTFAITTQDINTTYANMGNATTAANGKAGLVPAPTKDQYNYFLTGHGWDTNAGTAAYATNAGTATRATNATNADTATYATNAGTAASATKDSAGQQINTTYLKNATVSGRTVTFTKGDGSTFAINTQDNNTTYANMGNATTSANGTAGLVPAPTKDNYNYFLTGHGWATNVGTAAYATNAGTAAYGTKSGTATYANSAGSAGSANTAGTATYANSAGAVAWGNVSGKPSTFTAGAGTATYDSAGQQINTTYLKNASVSGKVVTFTKGDGSTFSITTQDKNTTYANMGNATTAANGTAGLVPAPTKDQYNYYLTGHGWDSNVGTAAYATNAGTATYANSAGAVAWGNVSGKPSTFTAGAGTATYATNAGTSAYGTKSGTATYATNAGTATRATNATNADTATYATNAGAAGTATKDSAGQQINTTYLKNASVSGRTVTFTKGDGSTFSISTQDNNTTYANMTAATTSANGKAGLVPAPTKDQYNYYLTGHGWATNVGTAAYATNSGTATRATNATNADTATYANSAGSAGSATKDSAGQQISTTYLKNASVSGKTVTFTKGDGSTFSITTQDNNTTYANMTAATTSANGKAGLVPAPTSAQYNYFLTGHGWATNVGTAAYATNSGTATYATNSGTATYANSAGSAGSANTAGTATYANSAGAVAWGNVSGKPSTFTAGAGTATYATNAGTATYATNAGTAAYGTKSGTATYANNAATASRIKSSTTVNVLLDDVLLDFGNEG